uniref:starch synthase n=1 Tax=Cicer arietinum TaxID=3827 RepID=A0A3Q7YH44_CICAR|nr:probable starch synthase 4, chloroplastic/amyloplastic isoform X3 [Cicer arietinum]
MEIPMAYMNKEGNKNEDMSKSFSDGDEQNVKHGNIWQLFREAQQNILYLNNQRLSAIEELHKSKKEKQSLLDKIKKLEGEKQGGAGKNRLSICSELLLRIDSMVLGSVISPAEASELRSFVLNHKVSVADVFNVVSHKRDSELLGELRHFSDESKRNGFHIIHICTEMTPLVPRGSVASYVTGISRALQRKGHLVEVILPKYACLDLEEVQGLREVNVEAYSYFNGQIHGNKIWTGVVYDIGVTLIEPQHYSSFFSREMIYGYPDDFERFSYFCRASLDYIVKCGKQPDILHLHNWETAIVGPLFWDIFVNKGLGGTRILLTCHGFNSQGIEQPDKLALCGLDPSSLHRPDRLQDNTNTQLVNILKGGVVYSNRVVIMSSFHPKHAIVRNLSHELEPTLNVHWDKLVIAPYGFDKSTWDPSTDYFLPKKFNAENMSGKAVCKVALLQRLGLSEHSSITVVGCNISEGANVDEKKIKDIALNAKQQDVQFICMWTSERPVLNQALDSLQKELKDDNIKFVRANDEALLHLLFAGSDIILCLSFLDPTDEIPSLFRSSLNNLAVVSLPSFQQLENIIIVSQRSAACCRCWKSFPTQPLPWRPVIGGEFAKEIGILLSDQRRREVDDHEPEGSLDQLLQLLRVLWVQLVGYLVVVLRRRLLFWSFRVMVLLLRKRLDLIQLIFHIITAM